MAVNGEDIGLCVLDTGMTRSVLDVCLIDRVKHIALGGDKVEGATPDQARTQWRVDSLTVGGVQIKGAVVFANDLSGAREALGVPVLGIVGEDILSVHPFTIDYRRAPLTFHDQEYFQPSTGSRVERVTLVDNLPCVRVVIDGLASGLFCIDTGFDGTVDVHDEFPERFGWKRERGDFTKISVTLDGMEKTSIFAAPTLDMFGQQVHCGEMSVTRSGFTGCLGNVGDAILSQYRLTFDYAGGRAWIEDAGDWSTSDWLKRCGGPKGHDVAGTTSLMLAARAGLAPIVRALIEAGADVQARDNVGSAVLLYAARGGSVDVVKMLLEHGASVAEKDGSRYGTPLGAAAARGRGEIVRLLLRAGANPNLANQPGQTPLHLAAEAGYVEIVQLLIEAKAKLDPVGIEGVTPLFCAIQEGYEDVVSKLLEAGSDPGKPVGRDMMRPLMLAAESDNPAIARLLVQRGAKLDDADGTYGATALMLAALHNHVDMVKLLLSLGADPTRQDKAGRTALDYARAGCSFDSIPLLREAKRPAKSLSLP
jgi:ankyrin repeat protein